MRGRTVIVAMAVAAAFGLTRLTVLPVGAQYPPTSNMTVQIAGSSTGAQVGGTVSMAVTVQDTGTPQPGVACSFAVDSQPGNDAKLATTEGTTNSQGIATTSLFVGSSPGKVDVTATCNGVTQHFGMVLGASTSPATVALPNSGSGPTGTHGDSLSWLVIGLALLGGAGALTVTRARRMRQ